MVWLLFEGKKKSETHTAINISVSESFEEIPEKKKIRSQRSFSTLMCYQPDTIILLGLVTHSAFAILVSISGMHF